MINNIKSLTEVQESNINIFSVAHELEYHVKRLNCGALAEESFIRNVVTRARRQSSEAHTDE